MQTCEAREAENMAVGVAFIVPAADALDAPLRPMSLAQRIAKRSLDIGVALVALILLAPLFLVIAIAVLGDGEGPVFFSQTREGYLLSSFTILKFRTMVRRGSCRFEQARPDDPRVTAVGAYLRATSFDELPQLLNVLFGTVSLVGPRPHVPELSARFAARIEGYYERLDVRPGITGLAQISGLRGETETLAQMAARVRFDQEYVRNWTFAGDLAICFKTLFIPLGQDRAY
jgi:lipopolysaccharide/colanic/teichoic acid biosynthesis glycosyltransferase